MTPQEYDTFQEWLGYLRANPNNEAYQYFLKTYLDEYGVEEKYRQGFEVWAITGRPLSFELVANTPDEARRLVNAGIHPSQIEGRASAVATTLAKMRSVVHMMRDKGLQQVVWGYKYVSNKKGPEKSHRETHRRMDGTQAPKNHEIWKEWIPPNGYNCKCVVIPILMKRKGAEPKIKLPSGWRSLHPDPGFRESPAAMLKEEKFGGEPEGVVSSRELDRQESRRYDRELLKVERKDMRKLERKSAKEEKDLHRRSESLMKQVGKGFKRQLKRHAVGYLKAKAIEEVVHRATDLIVPQRYEPLKYTSSDYERMGYPQLRALSKELRDQLFTVGFLGMSRKLITEQIKLTYNLLGVNAPELLPRMGASKRSRMILWSRIVFELADKQRAYGVIKLVERSLEPLDSADPEAITPDVVWKYKNDLLSGLKQMLSEDASSKGGFTVMALDRAKQRVLQLAKEIGNVSARV